MTVKITASIQARTRSSRLPGKVLLQLGGEVSLKLMVKRLKRVGLINHIVVATTDSAADDQISELFKNDAAVEIFRGSEHDVLRRLTDLGRQYPGYHHLELFGDSPFTCTAIILRAIREAVKNPEAIITNARQNLFPHGMEFLVYPFDLLLRCDEKIALNDPLREHGGSNLLIGNANTIIDLKPLPKEIFEEVYLEVDEAADYTTLAAIADILSDKQLFPYFTLSDILDVIRENREVLVNKEVERRWRKVQEQF